MKKIGIIKLKSEHDIEWNLPKTLTNILTRIPFGVGDIFRKIDQNNGKSFMPQITPYYLASIGKNYSKKHNLNYKFEVIDDYPENIPASDEYGMVWFTTLTTTAKQVYKKAQEFKEKGVKTVAGGIHPSMLPDETIKYVDSVAKGEGENTIPEILEDFSKGNLKKIYEGKRIENLNNLSIPEWKLAKDNYAQWILPIQTSRGCGNACYHCSTTRFQGRERRHRPIEDIINEIEYYTKTGFLTKNKVIFFTDNNSIADTNYRKGIFDTNYSKELFRKLSEKRKQGLIISNWIGQGEINMANDKELLELATSSGCILQLIGFESLSQENLDNSNKIGNRVEQYPSQIKKIHDYGISIIGCFMVGMPNDPPNIFKKTKEFIQEHIDIPQISLLTPYPGTVLYNKARKKGLIIHNDWDKYDITHVIMKPECKNKKGDIMTPRELEYEYSQLIKKLYSWPSMIKRSIKAANRTTTFNPRSKISKFGSVLAPNIIYKELSIIGRK